MWPIFETYNQCIVISVSIQPRKNSNYKYWRNLRLLLSCVSLLFFLDLPLKLECKSVSTRVELYTGVQIELRKLTRKSLKHTRLECSWSSHCALLAIIFLQLFTGPFVAHTTEFRLYFLLKVQLMCKCKIVWTYTKVLSFKYSSVCMLISGTNHLQ